MVSRNVFHVNANQGSDRKMAETMYMRSAQSITSDAMLVCIHHMTSRKIDVPVERAPGYNEKKCPQSFKRAQHKLHLAQKNSQWLSTKYFPCWPKLCERAVYRMDKEKQQNPVDFIVNTVGHFS